MLCLTWDTWDSFLVTSSTNQSSAEWASPLPSWQCHSPASPEFPVLQSLSSQTKCNFQAVVISTVCLKKTKIELSSSRIISG